MRKALAEAQAAFDEGEIPIGAIVVCQDRIIARAHNLTETLHDVTAHAVRCVPEPWAGARYPALFMAVATRSVATPTMRPMPCTPNVRSLAVYWKTNVVNSCKISSKLEDNIAIQKIYIKTGFTFTRNTLKYNMLSVNPIYTANTDTG